MRRTTIILALMALGLTNLASAADPPETINYQGVLRDSADNPVSDGSYAMVFRFYSVAGPGGSAILQDAQNVTVTGGLFSAEIGRNPSDGPGPGVYHSLAKVFADFSDLYIEVEVGGETLAPRIHLASAGYALNARHVRGREIVSEGPIDLYVDATNGLDANSGLLPNEAKKTIQAAIDAIPAVLAGEVRVHIEPGVYNEKVTVLPHTRIQGIHGIRLFKEPARPGIVVIDGTNLADPGEEGPGSLVLVADIGVEIKDVTARNFAGPGFSAEFASYLFLVNCRAENNDTGASAFAGGLLDIQNSVFTNNQTGIFSESSAGISIGDGVEISDNLQIGVRAAKNSSIEFKVPGCSITNNDLAPEDHSSILYYAKCVLTAATCNPGDSSARCVP